ncbi:MAG: heme ABC transporter ATP-binding protein [Alkalilacustris sp.]
MLTACGITVRLGRREVLRGVDFDARPGALTAIVGPNGSGKTTLLRALVGDLPDGGTVLMDGTPLSRLKPWDLAARRAVLPQATPLAFPFTVREVVGLGLAAGPHAAEPGIAAAALAAVGLQGYGGRFFQELSGGEQARAQLARVLAQVWAPVARGRARWLFLDEPVASLDIGHQLQVMRLARDYAARGGGVVAVMHDLNLTAMFADAVALIHDGRILASGPPAQVLTDANLSHAYACPLRTNRTPAPGQVFVLPQAVADGTEVVALGARR